MSSSSKTSRRKFLKKSATATTAVAASQVFAFPNIVSARSPNEKLNVAGIGVGGRGMSVLSGVGATENIVALADVDSVRAEESFKKWGKATRYVDFREMLDKEAKNIDAVAIATPDHTHATCALPCMQLGKHVYVEKPLTRTPWEARLLKDAAEKYGVATQMGNQGYSHDATRVAAEIIWSGEIGDVREVHAWTGRASWPQGMKSVPAPSAIPDTFNWDLWLGGAADRPFTAGDDAYLEYVKERNGGRPSRGNYGFYAPFNWRGFHDFGSGLIGDWGVHIMGPANWALRLGDPISVECIHKNDSPPFTFPDELTIKYEFAAREGMPPVTVYWYHKPSGDAYLPSGMTVEAARKIPDKGPQVGPPRGSFGSRGRGPRPGTTAGRPGGTGERSARPGESDGRSQRGPRRGPPGRNRGDRSGYNCVFVGSDGYLGTSGRGEGVGLLPGERWAEYKLPEPFLARSPGASTGSHMGAHCRDWIRACKGGAPSCSNFGVAAPYTEWLVLGAIAVRVEGKLEWDAANLRFKNSDAANALVKPVFRKGWEIS